MTEDMYYEMQVANKGPAASMVSSTESAGLSAEHLTSQQSPALLPQNTKQDHA